MVIAVPGVVDGCALCACCRKGRGHGTAGGMWMWDAQVQVFRGHCSCYGMTFAYGGFTHFSIFRVFSVRITRS